MIIGISGKARTGKDSIASFLEEKYDYEVWHWSDPLYDECRQPHNIMVEIRATDGSAAISSMIDGQCHTDPGLSRAILRWFRSKGDLPIQWNDEEPGRAWLENYAMTEKDGQFLQWWGTEYRRKQFDDLYWIDRLSRRLPEDVEDRKITIADTRFPNEAQFIRSLTDGLLIRVEAKAPFEDTGRPSDHPSEIALDGWTDWDARFRNEGHISNLFMQVSGFMGMCVEQDW